MGMRRPKNFKLSEKARPTCQALVHLATKLTNHSDKKTKPSDPAKICHIAICRTENSLDLD